MDSFFFPGQSGKKDSFCEYLHTQKKCIFHEQSPQFVIVCRASLFPLLSFSFMVFLMLPLLLSTVGLDIYCLSDVMVACRQSENKVFKLKKAYYLFDHHSWSHLGTKSAFLFLFPNRLWYSNY